MSQTYVDDGPKKTLALARKLPTSSSPSHCVPIPPGLGCIIDTDFFVVCPSSQELARPGDGVDAAGGICQSLDKRVALQVKAQNIQNRRGSPKLRSPEISLHQPWNSPEANATERPCEAGPNSEPWKTLRQRKRRNAAILRLGD